MSGPEPRAQNLVAGWYQLTTEGVENPYPDRRVRRDWSCAETFPVGIYRIRSHTEEYSGHRYEVFEITRYDPNDYGRISFTGADKTRASYQVAAALGDHLEPYRPTGRQIADECIGERMGASASVLDMLHSSGVITEKQIREAAQAVLDQWGAESHAD